MVVSWSPEWKLPLLMNHHILSHRPPPPPAAERRQDLISLGWNKKICWWKWSGDSLCCTRNHFWMTVCVCVCYHVAHCVCGGGSVSAALIALSQHSVVWAFTHSVDRRTARPRFCGSTQNRREKTIRGYFRKLSKAPHEWRAEALLCITAVNTLSCGQSRVSCKTFGGSQERGVDYDFIAFHRQKEYPFPSIPWWPLWRLWARGQTGCWWTSCWTCSWVHRLTRLAVLDE